MSLLDSPGGLFGAKRGALDRSLIEQVLQLVRDPKTGGLAGLVRSFQQQGLGHVVQSWIEKGPNAAITPQQIVSVLGQDRVRASASKLGLSPGVLAGQLSMILPQIVDRLTPDGVIPAAPASTAATR